MKKLTIILLLICFTCSLSSCKDDSSKKTTKHTNKIISNKTTDISDKNTDISDKTVKDENDQTNTTTEEVVIENVPTEDTLSNDTPTAISTNNNESNLASNNIPIYTPPVQEPEQPYTEDTNNAKKKTVRIFSHNSLNDSITYFDKEIEVIDGALTKALVEALKDPSIAAIPGDAYVRSASIDKNNDMITINFGDKFIDTTKVGSTSEYYVLTATINTFCYNFGVSKALITLNGNPYESGHVSMVPGQTFSANYSECYSK